jgi:hypothetical protein
MGRKYPSLGLNRRCRPALQQIRTPDPNVTLRQHAGTESSKSAFADSSVEFCMKFLSKPSS